MNAYADPELLVAAWLHDTLAIETCTDPVLPATWRFDTPVAHVRRGQSLGQTPLSLDDALLDIDTYAANADDARKAAADIWAAMVLRLPQVTFDNGIFCTHVTATMPPVWGPDSRGYRRAATYQVILHGFVTA